MSFGFPSLSHCQRVWTEDNTEANKSYTKEEEEVAEEEEEEEEEVAEQEEEEEN